MPECDAILCFVFLYESRLLLMILKIQTCEGYGEKASKPAAHDMLSLCVTEDGPRTKGHSHNIEPSTLN